MELLVAAFIGLLAGALSGMLGIGGGILMVPLLVLLLGYSQQKAQGTSLAVMLPPIGLAAAIKYYEKGFVAVWPAAVMAAAFITGSYVTAAYIHKVPEVTLKRSFGVLLLFVGGQFILGAGGGWAWITGGVAAFFAGGAVKSRTAARPEAPKE